MLNAPFSARAAGRRPKGARADASNDSLADFLSVGSAFPEAE